MIDRPAASLAGKRVLIIEDEFLVAAMLEDLLEDAGASVVGTASTLADGLRLAVEAEFDIAVLDWNLGGERSGPIANALLDRGVPFVVSTGYGALGEEFSNIPVVTKPYDPDVLERTMVSLLAAPAPASPDGTA